MENKNLFNTLAEIVESYILENSKGNTKVIDYQRPADLEKKLGILYPQKPGNMDDLIDAIRKYLKFSVRTSHKQYFNQLWAGFSFPAFLGEIFTALSNTSMSTYEIAPVATILETRAIEKMCNLVGYKEGDGLFVTGASNANLLAVLMARNEHFKNIKACGLAGFDKKPVLFISEDAHYSFLKAANISGIGMDNVIKVATDRDGRMIPEKLKSEIEGARSEGKYPFMVGATAGTTVRGAFDPLNEIFKIAKEYNLWFHIDGALGGSVVFSRKYAKLLEGKELSDSFAWNTHKMMGLPIICSAILVKKKDALFETTSSGMADEHYIFHDNETSSYDLGPKSLQCGRKVDALKLWLAWIFYGEEGFERRVDKLFELAIYAEKKVKENPKLELLAPLQSVSVCFRYIPKSGVDKNSFNINLRQRLLEKGLSIVNYANLGEKIAIRLVTMNPELEFKDIDTFLDNVCRMAEQ